MDTIEFTSGQQESSSGPPLHYLQVGARSCLPTQTIKRDSLSLYFQEIARKDVEIKELRQQQFQAETSLRELQLNISVKEERYMMMMMMVMMRMISGTRTGSRSLRTVSGGWRG